MRFREEGLRFTGEGLGMIVYGGKGRWMGLVCKINWQKTASSRFAVSELESGSGQAERCSAVRVISLFAAP